MAPGSSVTSRDAMTGALPPVLVALRTPVALEAGGADTYTQRAIPGSDLFRVRSPRRSGYMRQARFARSFSYPRVTVMRFDAHGIGHAAGTTS